MKNWLRLGLTMGLLMWVTSAGATTEIRLAVHDSYDLPSHLLNQFEKEHQARVVIIKMGDANAMLNRLILTRGKYPLADAVFGLDNNNIYKAKEMGILAEQQPSSQPTDVALPYALAIDFGFVTLNYDKKWFAQRRLALPKSLEDLTKPEYKDLLVIPNPGTSTPGLAFLLANIGGMGEEKAFAWWAKMRQNGVKVTKGWSDAYYTEFSANGGSRPIMVGYATSPAAEVFYSDGKLHTPNMGNLFLPAGSYLQIEGAAVLKGTQQADLAGKLVQYLQSQQVQESILTSMWVYPAVSGIEYYPIILHASVPKTHYAPQADRIAAHQKAWVARWIKTVLK